MGKEGGGKRVGGEGGGVCVDARESVGVTPPLHSPPKTCWDEP